MWRKIARCMASADEAGTPRLVEASRHSPRGSHIRKGLRYGRAYLPARARPSLVSATRELMIGTSADLNFIDYQLWARARCGATKQLIISTLERVLILDPIAIGIGGTME